MTDLKPLSTDDRERIEVVILTSKRAFYGKANLRRALFTIALLKEALEEIQITDRGMTKAHSIAATALEKIR